MLPAPQQHQLSRAERNSVCLHCREVMLSRGCCAWTTCSRHHNSSSSCRVQLARMPMPRLRERWVSFWFLSLDDITWFCLPGCRSTMFFFGPADRVPLFVLIRTGIRHGSKRFHHKELYVVRMIGCNLNLFC